MKKDARYYENKNHEQEQFKKIQVTTLSITIYWEIHFFLNGRNF